MRRIAVAIVALSLAGPALAADAAGVYAAKCAACHGKDGKGTAIGQKMGAHDLTALKDSEAQIAATITNGKGKMSPYKGKLSDEEIKSLAKFVKGGLK
jgi:cytochrome c6